MKWKQVTNMEETENNKNYIDSQIKDGKFVRL